MPEIKLCAFADESGAEAEVQIENMLKNGVYAVEMRSCDAINVGAFTDEKAAEVYEKFLAAGIEVWSIGSPLGKISIDSPFNEHFELLARLVRTAKIMHSDKIRMFSYFVKRGDYAAMRDEVLSRMKKLCDYAASEDVVLCHENESEIFGATVDNCRLLLDAQPRLRQVYDPANFLMWDEDIEYALDKLYSDAYYFHIKDVVKSQKCIVPAGFGDGKIEEMVRRLDRDATFTIEPHLHIFDGYAGIDKKQLKNKFVYPDQPTAFAAAVDAFKRVMKDNGYKEEKKGIWKK
jgi:xylose isomerase domain protein TIM barrel